MKFLISTLYMTLSLPLLLRWIRQQSERQIDKMQEAAFNTPGAEAPVPPDVVVGGVGLLLAHFVIAQKVLGLRAWQALLSLLLGAGAGLGIVFNQRRSIQ